ncbi:low-density lipoprotein receptor-related protein 4 [Epargyreus clarus]|uniref:low-density lipoprotein receptor-related protein 4 n=1 Tax=Epargyreus clarus TaxID=520877 RepID=UPI003C308317
MPAPLAIFFTLLFLWICVNGDDAPPIPTPRTSNTSVDAPDPRSAIGRVPPFQPPNAVNVPGIIQVPGYRPHSPYTRIDSWHYGRVPFRHTYVASDDDDVDDGGCHEQCTKDEFACQLSCTCIPMEKRCNNVVECAESEDEAGCEPVCDENENRTLCQGTSECILLSWICDGDNDCGDFSDETNCVNSPNCTIEQYQCKNGLCVHKQWLCDGDNDCHDNSDEIDCPKNRCQQDQFTCASGDCVSLHWQCDREPDCADNSDEAECPVELLRCGESEFQCNNKNCIRKDFQCDTDNDCGDWTDEDSCPILPTSCSESEFKCSDGKCIPDRWHCDGERDCKGGEDELNCEPHGLRNCSSDEYTCADRRCILKTWLCDGHRDCTNSEDETDCQVNCEVDQYMCKSVVNTPFKNCLSRKHVCDGIKDCPQGDDEEKCPTRRSCKEDDKCEKICITTYDGKPACDCPLGYLLGEDGFSCRDIDECMYEQDPVCSQTCSNSAGGYACGCMSGYVLRPDARSCKAVGDSATLMFANRVDIRQVSLTGSNYVSVVKGLHNAVALDYHYEKKLVFWTENNMRVIRSAIINTNNRTDVIRWGLDTPSGVAVDWIHDLLFWTDSGSRRVEVATINGTNRIVLAASDIDKPRAIAVHPGDALVFWTDWGPNPKIERANMDGTRRKSVIFDQLFWPNGLTIDYTESKIYWADAKHHVIEKALFDGRDRKRVVTKGLPHPFALTLFEDAIYWTDWHTKSISSVDKMTGKGMQTVHAGIQLPMDIHTYHPSRQLRTFRNHCGGDGGGCSHLCLPNAAGYACRCPIGLSLMADGRTCKETLDKLLLYTRSKDIRLKQLNPRTHLESLDMVSYKKVVPVQNIKSAVALDWDHNSNSIFWTDVDKNTINRAFLNGSNQTVIVKTNLITPAGLAYDWMTDKLYWSDYGTNRIEVSNPNGTMRSLLAWKNVDKPRDIVLDPKGGLMYWSNWGANPSIERAYMDGTHRQQLIVGRMSWPSGLALDLPNNKIYWTDGGNCTIEYANLDGTGRTVLISEHLTHPFGLDVYGDEVFWTDWETHSIQAANKYTGQNRRTLGAGVEGLMDVRVFHKERRSGVNRCSKNNGGCSHLCLLKPGGRTCACPTGVRLSSDGKTCTNGPINFLIFAHRVDIRVVSLDMDYMVDVVLPLPPLRNALGVDVDQKTGYVYWTDTAERVIVRASKHGEHIETVIRKGLHTVDGIVIDSTGRKLYWTDGGRNSIEVSDLDGLNRKVLVWTGLDSPRAIALYYEGGYMFWSDWGTSAKIERADMDGKNRRIIVDVDIKWPNGLAVDRIEGRLYWNDAKEFTIESSDFNGNDRRVLMKEVPYPYGIVIVGQHIYWTDWKTKALHRADKSNGKEQLIIRDNLDGLMDIRAIQSEHVIKDVCNANGLKNGGCSHLCLRNPQGFSCICPTGLLYEDESDPNPKICKRHPDNFLIFATRDSISMISLDTPEQWDLSLPLKNIFNSIAVDFHWEKKLIYFTDVNNNSIRAINMSNTSQMTDVITKRLDTPNGLGVDWIANNLYWTDNEYKVLEVSRLDGSSRKILLSGLTEPRSLALFPAKGFLYWSDWGENPNIERCALDGTQRKIIIDHDLGFPNGLTIDYKDRRLYWTDALKDRIDTSDLNGQHRVQLIPDAKNPFGMTQFKEYIYWTDWYKKSVMRADKRTGQNVTAVTSDLEMAMEIKAVAAEKQHGWSPCKESNGGCTHLCLFRGHDYVCACPDEPDSRVCSTTPNLLVELRMPSHYPSYYDYMDIEVGTAHKTTPVSESNVSAMVIAVVLVISIIIIISVIVYLCLRKRANDTEAKDDFGDGSGHISFHNPNYSAAAAALDPDRRPRFQGIFKYDKHQDRLANVYIPEGTSLLPPPPPPPHRAPPRPSTHDDFEPVTLHPFA